MDNEGAFTAPGARRVFAGMSGSPGSLRAAFAGLPPGLRAWPLVLGGKPAQVLVSTARQAGDVLIIGAGRRAPATVGLPGTWA